MRKKIDSRVRTLVENCVKTRHRSLFVIVGDKGRDQVVNLHYMLSKAAVKARPSVLWCYKKELMFSSHKKKRMRQIKKMAQRGLLDQETEDPFSLFVASTSIRYCYYSDTHKDFEGITPNLLARTIETVEGGGIIVMLLSTLTSLKQLFTLTMDAHARLKTESHQDVRGRFNERLVLSLAHCPTAILVDDELNILPTSSHIRSIAPVATNEDGSAVSLPGRDAAQQLKELAASLTDTQPAGALTASCRSLDQAKALLTFLDVASDKVLRSTVALTAARGRGKSAAMGLAIAGAVALGFSNIFVTAPTPENLRTLFEFVFKGLDALDYKEHLDYDLVESTNPDFGKAIVRVNIYRSHRQTIQYIQPQHYGKLGQAELLVVDEAAAIPLPLVKKMLGPYLVFLCSTVNGYEGTGRSLSLKLLSQLRSTSVSAATPKAADAAPAAASGGGRLLREVSLDEPIRYGPEDPVEQWLMSLLCLNAADHLPRVPPTLPHPDDCELLYVERDTLFSGHRVTEVALQRMMSLYVASHYKNTPNDLLLLSDAPAHHLFVLTAPVPDKSKNQFPDILAVVQVALEGSISRDSAQTALAAGQLPQGDLLPWMIGQQFQDNRFPSLSGARIVRVATHPTILSAGYGSRAIQELCRYYEGQISLSGSSDDEDDAVNPPRGGEGAAVANGGAGEGADVLHEEEMKPRAMLDLPPLFLRLAERPAERLHYVGVSFGLTQPLLRFWQKLKFVPLYLRQTASDITGENTCIMLKALASDQVDGTSWLTALRDDFCSRLIALLSGSFRDMQPATALALLQPKLTFSNAETQTSAGTASLRRVSGEPLDAHDLKRLQAYCNNIVDHHLVLDLAPSLARAFFTRTLRVTQSAAQAAILVVVGLQGRDVSAAAEALNLPSSQVLALFMKSMKRFAALLQTQREEEIARELPVTADAAAAVAGMRPQAQGMEEELEEGAAALEVAARERIAAMDRPGLEPERLQKYAIKDSNDAFEEALGGAEPSGALHIKKAAPEAAAEKKPKMYEKKVKGGKRRQAKGGVKKKVKSK